MTKATGYHRKMKITPDDIKLTPIRMDESNLFTLCLAFLYKVPNLSIHNTKYKGATY
ncbi:hypothetical protein FOXB_04357 [Fusarium oxysporum f. sp. conglutinans Fo5176]|uniref:Uncharacterized protein n=1 Tax=Fusarium oxysporum (strain Fo5176) TaxID=660025 RepID=F9FD79_FUSOF|nr:hypothetical protein FOXB_04357 [Fusarium oxysporum f. sp. conglutinans Fo5176]